MDVFNIYGVLILFLLTDVLQKTFDVGIEFSMNYKPEYDDLENAETKQIVKQMESAVSTIVSDLETMHCIRKKTFNVF